jgi:hypothetical protein
MGREKSPSSEEPFGWTPAPTSGGWPACDFERHPCCYADAACQRRVPMGCEGSRRWNKIVYTADGNRMDRLSRTNRRNQRNDVVYETPKPKRY